MSKYYGVLLTAALFLVSLATNSLHLATNSLHWLTEPPGIDSDAARLGLYAHDLLQDLVPRLFPFYVYHQFAPHPLIIYVQSLVFAVLGYSVTTLRGVTIVGGALATPAIYWASRWLCDDQGAAFARKAGLIAALGLALSTSFNSISRWGNEGPLLPFVELMAVAFLWRGFRRGRWIDFVLAGLFVGISQYVYIVARFFPVALAVASIGAILANPKLLARWRGLILAATSAALVALPQWILFVTHPYTFTARTSNPMGPLGGQFIFELPDPVSIIAAKLTNQLLIFVWSWDNINLLSSKPLLTPVLVVGLAVSVATTICRRRDYVYVFGFLMMVMMLLPDLLTYERYAWTVPSLHRIVPALPFIFIMAGLGAATLWAWIESRRRLPNRAGYFVLLLVLSSGLLRQWDFATRVKPQVLAIYDLEGKSYLNEIAIAEYIGIHLERPILLTSSQYHSPALAFLLAESFPHREGGVELPIKQGEIATVIQPYPDRYTNEGSIPSEWVLLRDRTVYFLPPIPDNIEPLNGEETAIVASNGVVVAKAFAARWQGEAPTYIPLQATFANNLNLVGYQSSDFKPGSLLNLTFYWQPAQEIKRDVEMFVQLYDPIRQTVVAIIHRWPLNGNYRVRAWQPHKTMPLTLSLSIPDNLTPGPYQLRVGVLDLIARKRIPLLTGEDSQLVKTFKIPLPVDHRIPESSSDIKFGNIIALNGYTLTPISDGLKVTFFWRSIDTPQADYTTFIHIVDTEDQIVAQMDVQPLHGQYPTSVWSPNELIVDERTVTGIPKGEYRIYIGWYLYREDALEPLQVVSNGSQSTTDRLLLEAITVP